MELKRINSCNSSNSYKVLIVPFMELKQSFGRDSDTPNMSLNRTFYGIETRFFVLSIMITMSLNRTFYGIETSE